MQFCQACSVLAYIPSAVEAYSQTRQSTEEYPVENNLALGWWWTKLSDKTSSPLVFIIWFSLKHVAIVQVGNSVMCRPGGQHQTCGLGLSVVKSQGSCRVEFNIVIYVALAIQMFHHCDKQAALCSHQDFQMSGILQQEKPYLSRAYFYGMYYEKGSLGNSKSPECLLKWP